MLTLLPFSHLLVLAMATSAATPATTDPANLLPADAVASVRVNLPPRGADLGFEVEVPGDDRRARALADLVREGEPRRGCKCANDGAIRFLLTDGRVIGVGLLGSHDQGPYALRLYDGERLVGVKGVDREALFPLLLDLGVPPDAHVLLQ